jgi:hypothetical protein
MSLMIFNPYTLESAQGIKFQALNTWVDGFAFLCTLPKEKPKVWNIFLPFSPLLWFLYISLFVTVCLLFLLNSAAYRAMGSTDSDMIDNLLRTLGSLLEETFQVQSGKPRNQIMCQGTYC